MEKFDYDAMVYRYEIAKRQNMIEQIDKRESIVFFNARKSLYVNIEDDFLGRIIKFLAKIQIKLKLRKLKCKK